MYGRPEHARAHRVHRVHCALLLAGFALLAVSLALAGCAPDPGSQPPGVSGPNGLTTTSPGAVDKQARTQMRMGQVDAAAHQIRYTSQDVTLIAVGSPPGHAGEDEFWQVNGLVNPRIIVPAGAHITVKVVNGDPDMLHGWILTSAAPPYSQMPMMGGRFGGMGSMPIYALVPPLPEAHGDQWPMTTIKFTAPPTGQYYYLCQVPDHAEEGMWGTLIVR